VANVTAFFRGKNTIFRETDCITQRLLHSNTLQHAQLRSYYTYIANNQEVLICF